MFAVPDKDTPLNITVTRFAHDGMPVKSIAVPDVDACAVPDVITYPPITGVLIVGLVSVLLVSVCVSVVPTIVPDGCVP